MNKILFGFLISGILFLQTGYYGSSTASVTLAGGIIKSKHQSDSVVRYKRKDCPVCKGKGWYISGDDIKKIECNYCEPEKGSTTQNGTVTVEENCPNNFCPINKSKGQ